MSEHKAGLVLGWIWKIGRWLVLAVIVGGIVYQMRFAPVTVQSISPTRQTIKSEVMGTGTLEARISTTISPKIAGRIGEVLVDQGKRFSKDSCLYDSTTRNFSSKWRLPVRTWKLRMPHFND